MQKRLLYTFGNHMHWAGMQWLWGHATLASSTRDMLAFARATGTRGNVNFDAIGYEKLAAQSPETFAELRAAVDSGLLEIVGGSYGQACGLFHGGESNIRTRVLGARVVRRLFGLWPRAFWESKFDFFPQLPQLLAGCGYRSAALFCPSTWNTPYMPDERVALIEWQGLDGTSLPALPRNELCAEPWPEELERCLASKLIGELARPALLQWLELLPTPDWICRSEPFVPRLRALASDPRTELSSATLSQLVETLRAGDAAPPVRRYTLDDVFHGASLGKNGDYMPRYSRTAEEQLLAAESISSLAGLFGRPYASWDVYPAWELDEAWRELAVAQHHFIHERESLCGTIGEHAFERSLALSGDVFARTLEHLGRRVDALEGSTIVFNPLGWTRDVVHEGGVVRSVPAYGYRVIDPYDEMEEPRLGRIEMQVGDTELTLARGDFEVRIDKKRGLVTQIVSREFPDGVFARGKGFGALEMRREGKPERFETVNFSGESSEDGDFAEFTFVREGRGGSRLRIVYSMSMLHDALWMRIHGENLARPDPGVHNGLSLAVQPGFEPARLVHDHPYGVSEVRAERDHLRKYPTGDWMTSARVFEEVVKPFTAHTFVDLLDDTTPERGLLVVHDGSQQFFREPAGVRALLSMYDPWDGEHFDNVFDAELWLAPHAALSHTERARLSMECNLGSPRFEDSAPVGGGGDLPPQLGSLEVDCANVLATAFYRESQDAAEHVDNHFAREVHSPFVLRLVEFDGLAAEVTVRVPGPIARAAKTNLLGAVIETLIPRATAPPFGPAQLPWSALRFTMRPHEIATVMLDLEFGRATPRNTEDFRSVWSAASPRST